MTDHRTGAQSEPSAFTRDQGDPPMRKHLGLTPIVALLLLFVSFGCKPSRTVPHFEALETCFAQPPGDLEVEFDMDCGYVVVPEFHHSENGRTLKLGITRLNSGRGTASSPLFMLAGGPGQTQISPDLFRLFQPELPDSTDVNLTVGVPTLLLTGNLDVATPTFRSRIVADALPNATLIEFPGRTHVQIAAVNLCAARVMTQFVLDPAAPLDTSCTEESPLLGFVLSDGSMSRETD